METRKFYWIKLKTDFFNQDTIDFLLSQKNGCEYIVLYQMLCLKTANNNGELSTNLGEIIVPYDVEKIVRDTRYFETDTVMVALDLFKKLGLIYQEENQMLKITDFEELVGSETKWAKYKRDKRIGQIPTNVQQEIEYRNKSKEIDKEKDIDNIYKHFESTFGRTLNPLEAEGFEKLLEKYKKEEIISAIDISASNGADNIKYITKVLSNKKKQVIPDWSGKEIINQELDEETKNEMEDFKEFIKNL